MSLQTELEELRAREKQLEADIASLDNKQLALKILLNSLYGALANAYFRFFDFRNAEGITTTGQYYIRKTGELGSNYLDKMSGKKDSLIYIDTDSNYFSLKSIVDKIDVPADKLVDALDAFCEKKIGKVIDDACDYVGDYLNVFENHLAVKREKICTSAVWVAKKRYALNVKDDEGLRLTEPYIAVTGLEVKRSSTPKICQDALKKVLGIVLESSEEELQDYVASVYEDFLSQPPEVVARPSGVKNLAKYSDPKTIYKKGCPAHVRASLLYNHYLKTHGLEGIYSPIHEGTKMKYVNLHMPNPIGDDVIGFVNKIPPELGLEDYVDYEELFKVGFISPVQKIATACSWNYERKATLDSFFC